ncbi:Ger(x)C family spore germination protein [Paenibacillus sp. LHD-117]|uniref:Ger(x)C family spore germination protein n=1 Tax=Paenibacillus sp. LHD-117 TaxID=3071412 RepID=UPI0027E0BAFC|nr:Ger(x)C family spore germination protein [Paenibacillus sp. LHD-117]MDQ6421629.1 Ger(x)C family spore germination protein [Paenibacillus sp. LHD-117]
MTMRSRLAVTISIAALFLQTGCWDHDELTEFGYVQAAAIDAAEDGKLELTTHFYRPSGGEQSGESGKSGKGGINIKTKAKTVFEAVRDIPIHFGRKAKWDHMRVILIGEELAKKQNIGDILDFFSRDHEPRDTISVLIAKGKASDYLDTKPLIEHTIGQQMLKMEETTSTYTAKTTHFLLLDLAIQLKSETNTTLVPFMFSPNKQKEISIAGFAVIKDGKMRKTPLSPQAIPPLLMLINQYDQGVLEIPCSDQALADKGMKEALEVKSLVTKLKTSIKDESVSVHVTTKLSGSVAELRCSTVKTEEEQKKLEHTIQNQVERDMRKTVERLQKEQLDVLGLGNSIYRKHPSLWKSWKPTWDKRFSEIRFDFKTEVNVVNTGTIVGTPFSK